MLDKCEKCDKRPMYHPLIETTLCVGCFNAEKASERAKAKKGPK